MSERGPVRHPLFDLEGSVALITGSTRGIGRAIAVQMAAAGARVVVSSRKAEACERVAAEIVACGGEALGVACNVSHREQLEALVERALGTWGRIDTLVCNAAANPYYGPLLGISDSAFDKTITVNLRSPMWLVDRVAPQMIERREGSIILLASIAGIKGTDLLGTYGLSKAAVMQLARSLAIALGKHNIRVNTIAPAVVKTDFARALWEDPQVAKEALARYPLGRFGEPDDIAGAAVFLAARAGSWMTGQTLVIDGGWTVQGL